MKDEYDLARDVLIEAIEDNNSIYDIWEYGTYKNPGLSDMDLMIIVNNDADVSRVKSDIEKVVKHNDVSSAMAHANPIVLPQSNCKEAFLWDDISAFSLRKKKMITDPISDRLLLNFRNNAMMVDFVFERIYRVNQYRIGNLEDFRRVLGVCKSLRYSFDRLADLITLDESTVSILHQFSMALDEVRASYTNDADTRQEKTQGIVQFACDAGEEVHKEIYRKGLPVFESITGTPGFSCDFVFPDKMIYSFDDELKISSEKYVNLPEKLLFQLLTYSLVGGALSSSLKSSFVLPCGIDFEKLSSWHSDVIEHNNDIAAYHHYLESRIKAANKWNDFLVERDMPYGLFKFGWYLPKH